ncbi:hypothetical protein NDU88_001340 [Pleurodeles waltl]|uniref:Uncharacterized protein n=1 Tax=Pleurodeles waltl TaxID=8319 RepID=A0AAV7WI22_PLEWA|nr:hypothetical protein NDU88_001340 [Pleurodeles waltl]
MVSTSAGLFQPAGPPQPRPGSALHNGARLHRSAPLGQQGSTAGPRNVTTRRPQARSSRHRPSQQARPGPLQHRARRAATRPATPQQGPASSTRHKGAAARAASAAYRASTPQGPNQPAPTEGKQLQQATAGHVATQGRPVPQRRGPAHLSPGSHQAADPKSLWGAEVRFDRRSSALRVAPDRQTAATPHQATRAPLPANQPSQESLRQRAARCPAQPRPGPPPPPPMFA